MKNKKSNYIFEGVDEKTLRNAIKQYLGKGRLPTSSIRKQKKDIFKKSSKDILKFIVFPILQRPLFENKIFYLYGGIMLPCDFSIEVGEVVAQRMAFRQSCQKITCIEKRKYNLVINYESPYLGLKNFQFLIDIYNSKGKQSYRDLAASLEKVQKNIVTWNQAVEGKYKKVYTNAEQYKKRVEEFTIKALQQIDELDQTKLYMFGIIIFDYEKRELSQTISGFSQGFLSLLGTEADQFCSINLRCGQPWNSIGDFIIDSIIVTLFPFSSGKFQSQKTEIDTVLVTLDGYYVHCKEIRQYFITQESIDLGYIEMGYGIVEFDVPLNGLKQLLSLRANRFNDSNIYNQFDYFTSDNFEYSMNSQIFLEKYYPSAITEEYLCCKFRQIQQKFPQVQSEEYEKMFNKEKSSSLVTSETQISNKGTISKNKFDEQDGREQFKFFQY